VTPVPGEGAVRTALGPTSREERALALDVLRGLALLGVLLINLDMFRGALFRYGLEPHPDPGWANRTVDLLRFWLFQGKSVSLLSMLFGVGLALQLERAEATGHSFHRLAARRLGALFVLGLLHTFLLWDGDILAHYAFVGAVSLLFIRRAQRTLWIWAMLLLLARPVIRFLLTGSSAGALFARIVHESLEPYGRGGYAEVFTYRLRELVLLEPFLLANWFLYLGCFLLGFLLARRGLLLRPAEHPLALRRLAVWALGGGLVGNLIATLVSDLWGARLGPVGRMAQGACLMLLYPGLALGYVAAVLLLLESPSRRRWLQPLACLGRMALTTYLSQSLILSFVFYGYGLGLYGKLSTVAATALGLVVFAVQVAACRWWLARFDRGPVEALWRAVTYGRSGRHILARRGAQFGR
jgi:uncharacterized protein